MKFWGLGREGEVVRELVPDFERAHPGIRVIVQQIPWTAAHEKLLTGFVGGSPPDLAQLGNTWIPEFAAIGALEPLAGRVAASAGLSEKSYFEGIWETNQYEGALYGIPWYVDTRVLFYRPDILAAAGYAEAPRTWSAWRDAMEKIRAASGGSAYAILLPTNEWEQLTILGIQKGSSLLDDGDTRGAFAGPAFREAAECYVGLFRDGLAPVVSYTQLGNPYQEFARCYFAMWITGPWNLGEFRRRLKPEEQRLWMTAPLPAPDGVAWPGPSLAGGRVPRHLQGLEREGRGLGVRRVPLDARRPVPFLRALGRSARPARGLGRRGARRGREGAGFSRPALARRAHAPRARVGADRAEGRRGSGAGDPRAAIRARGPRRARRQRRPHAREAAVDPRPGDGAMSGSAMAAENRARPARALPHEARAAVFLLAPGLAAILVLFLVPIAAAFLLSLTDFDIYALGDPDNARFVGLRNYANLLRDPLFWKAMRNTALFVFVGGPLTMGVGLAAALLVNSKLARAKGALPHDLLRALRDDARRGRRRVPLPLPPAVRPASTAASRSSAFRRSTGWAIPAGRCRRSSCSPSGRTSATPCCSSSPASRAFPESLYEAARIDGAGGWQLFRNITLPLLSPTLLFLGVITTIGYFQFFAEPYVMTDGGKPLNATLSVGLLMYKSGFRWWNMGYGAAVAFVLFLVVLAR